MFCSNLLGSLCEPVDGASVPSAMWETNASVLKWEKKKKKMFYLLCYFDLPLYFCSFVCFLLSKGLKFKAHTLMWGLANLHSSLNVMKSFCWFKPCVPNCMYIPLSMLWILTVHKKKYEENSVVGCISVNLEEKRKKKKNSHKLSHCVRFISQNAHRCWQNFAAVYKRFNTICIWWLVVVLLKHRPALCLSPYLNLRCI